MSFPATRMRRLRRTKALRDLVRETELSPRHLVQPLFVVSGESVREPVESMPGIERFSINELVAEASELLAVGIEAVILFGIPAAKDETGSGAYDDEGVVQLAVRALKEAHPELTVITDVCLCEYTSHGHCGFVRDGEVDNDITVELLAKTAISHAEAGADVVAPSDMMDGRIGDDPPPARRGGPPRHARSSPTRRSTPRPSTAPSARRPSRRPEFGDRRGYQMDPGQRARGAARGPPRRRGGRRHGDGQARAALPRRDPRGPRRRPTLPIAAYQVSGEYSMLKAAAANGWIDERAAALEALTSIRRAGADVILTYYAKEAAAWLA